MRFIVGFFLAQGAESRKSPSAKNKVFSVYGSVACFSLSFFSSSLLRPRASEILWRPPCGGQGLLLIKYGTGFVPRPHRCFNVKLLNSGISRRATVSAKNGFAKFSRQEGDGRGRGGGEICALGLLAPLLFVSLVHGNGSWNSVATEFKSSPSSLSQPILPLYFLYF